MVHGVDEHGCFGDVLFCEILRSDDLARHFYLDDFCPSPCRHIRPLSTSTNKGDEAP